MKTLIKILPIVVLLASCSSGDEVIKKKIIMKQTQIAKIEQQILELQKQLKDTAEVVNYIPVSVKEMQGQPFNHYFIVYGNVEADKYGNISPEMNGKVEKIHVQEGQRVKKGDLLLTLNTEAISKNIKAMEANLELAKISFDKQKALWDQKIGSEIQFLQAKTQKEGLEAQLAALKAQLKMALLKAPYDGIVNKIYRKPGEMAGPGFPVIEFVNLSNMTVRAQVSEKYISLISEGKKVELTFSSLPDFKIETPIVRVSKVINSKSRTFEIELNFKNKDEQVKPNMVSTIRINDYSNDSAFVIPSLVVKKDISGDYVYLVKQDNDKQIAEKYKVTLGKSYQDETEVISGLTPGDKVIVEGYSLVSSGVPVKIK